MIWLPGVLSQDGKKLTWRKYTVGYAAVAGTSTSISRTYSYSKMASKAYAISDGVFTLSSPSAKTFENLTDGDYVTDMGDSTSTATSGSTVYGIQSNSRNYTVSEGEGQQQVLYASPTVYGFSSYTIKDGMFVLSGSVKSANATTVASFYGYTSNSNPTLSPSAGSYSTIYRISISGLAGGTKIAYMYPMSLSAQNTVTIGYTPYTATAIRGTYIEDVEAKIGTYPENGMQNGYWYILKSGDSHDVNYFEYIQSSGTQYIDTGFVPNGNTRIVVDLQPVQVASTYLFGSRTGSSSSDHFQAIVASGAYRDDYASEKSYTTKAPGSRIVIDKNKNVTKIGDVSVNHTYTSFNGTCPIVLFAGNTGGTIGYYSSYKLYSCKIYDNGTLVRDYKPCLDPAGVACLYDEVNAEYVYNAGTGSFTAG